MSVRQKSNLFKRFLLILFIILTTLNTYSFVIAEEIININNSVDTSEASANSNGSAETNISDEGTAITSNIPSTYSPATLLMDLDSGQILYSKNANTKMYPASTTKIMTAILTIENCDLSDIAVASHNAIYSVPAGYSHANIQEGEELTIEQLLNVLLIPSANDAAFVLAEHIAGSVEAFSDMMNAKAAEIGCKNTHFVNPNGIHNEDHYSTAYDLALIGKYAMQYETFRDIASKTSCSLPATNKYPREDRLFNTTNELLKVNYSKAANNYYYPYATAGKTGYTDAAKNCIVATAKKDDMSLLVVVLHGERTEDGLSQRALDCKTLFEYGFNNFKHEVIAHKGDIAKQVSISGGTNDSKDLDLVYSEDITALVPSNYDITSATPNIKLTENMYAPISEGTNLGSITFSINGFNYSCDLLASHTVYKSDMSKTAIELCLVLIFLFIFAKILKFKKNRSKRRYKHAAKLRDYSKNLDGFYPKYR